ncbi:MAG: peptidoglycan D,D-transpeptidase FtsI family protein [Kiritimatiellia bacterium]|jgi:cell division protein FtsI (penicillin-binding protein 3)
MADSSGESWIYIIGAGLFLWMAAMGWRVCYLHLSEGKTRSYRFTTILPAPRGQIYDSVNHELPLAGNLAAWDVAIDYKNLPPEGPGRGKIAGILADAMDMDADVVLDYFRRACARGNRGLPLGRTLNPEVETLARSKGPLFRYVSTTRTYVRHYPQNERLCQTLGYVDKDGNGAMGLERALDAYLRGAEGRIVGTRDAFGNEIRHLRSSAIAPEPGADVFLTIDSRIQYAAETELRNAMEQHHATGAWAVVQRVPTGELLAIASMPDFDLNRYADCDRDCWRNKSVISMYEPGSTMKTLTVAAALNERIVTPDTVIDVGQGPWYYGGFYLRDHSDGPITVSTIIKKSSNKGTAMIALRLGNERLEGYLRALGFGSKVGIGLPAESPGSLDRHQAWDKVRPTRIAIGQGIAVTALQMANLYATLGNGGTMMKPFLVERVVAADGTVLEENRPTVMGRPFRPDTAAKMRDMLVSVTEAGGTAGRHTAVQGFRVAGKTGTAQIPGIGGYSQTDYWATFVGFAPAERPEVAIVVVVERPKPLHSGGVVAAPVFSRIATASLQYLGVTPPEADDTEASRERPFQ